MIKYKISSIPGLPKDSDLSEMAFGRQIEWLKKLETFKKNSKSGWVSQKNRPFEAVIHEFLEINRVKEFYTNFHPKTKNAEYWDDTFEIFYRN